MFFPSRRQERRPDVVEMLKYRYHVQDVIDCSGLEQDGVFLEGAGAMVPDQVDTIENVATILPLEVPTIELAGGSVRCMLAGIHLAARGPVAVAA